MDECNFDIVGTQEMMRNQPKDISNQYPHFALYDRIYYRRERFLRLDGGRFWLSPTPDIQSGSWETGQDRYCDWAKFRDKASGIVFYHYNIHFDHVSALAREESAKLMVRRLKAQAGNTPLFISGDFNSAYDSPAMTTMRSAFQDVFNLAASVDRGEERTHNNQNPDPGKYGQWIDYIYVNANDSRRFTVQSAAVNSKIFGTHIGSWWITGPYFASDHFPVIAVAEIK
jgi:endonuclease/exonuclease/phosphatase family metal-dependent hydrolase